MLGNKSLSNALFYLTAISAVIAALIVLYFLIMSFLGGINQLPKNFEASIEIPVQLHQINEHYPITALANNFDKVRIEVDKATLEAVPTNYRFGQCIFYLHAAFWTSFFFLVLFQLAKILETFQKGNPFPQENAQRFRRIGWLVLAFPVYNFLIRFGFSSGFQDAFEISNATILDYSLWGFDFITFFLGGIILLLGAAFQSGAVLQEYEEQTV